ncbi:hypothetical protein SEA_PETTERN_68 [Mycobacterium phage PetterN]|uniref:Lipoprotein n=2 Tax=Benedictvirus TaxID=2946819 RepID=A0A482J8M6_9CAUD|nr:hypothetical protein AVV06_gp30 [Mycobacterium phage Chadwick]YP_010060776.1 hypothetical protein KIP49_gp27 [Mycobacterium phage Scorpia]ALA06792.1 hypothetical protein SEA_CHADWICK_65 [Mycobacterium phage Chadwick]QBP29064.1 hypothetical protein SEA_SCORPIA_65 [Mycobacterium phage Scorpia]QGJ97113.1 hypothetical protein SEA_PETTERN_68 [Mycobacterium phage PetterN]
MKWFVALGALAVVLTGCSKASTSEDRFSVEYIDGAKCIIYAPYNDSGNGIQMECDFR